MSKNIVQVLFVGLLLVLNVLLYQNCEEALEQVEANEPKGETVVNEKTVGEITQVKIIKLGQAYELDVSTGLLTLEDKSTCDVSDYIQSVKSTMNNSTLCHYELEYSGNFCTQAFIYPRYILVEGDKETHIGKSWHNGCPPDYTDFCPEQRPVVDQIIEDIKTECWP